MNDGLFTFRFFQQVRIDQAEYGEAKTSRTAAVLSLANAINLRHPSAKLTTVAGAKPAARSGHGDIKARIEGSESGAAAARFRGEQSTERCGRRRETTARPGRTQ